MLILIAVISLIMIIGIIVIFVYLSKDRKKRRSPSGTFEIEEDGVITIKISYEELKKKQDEVKKKKAKKRAIKELKAQGMLSPSARFGDRQLSTIMEEEESVAETNEEMTLHMETRSELSSFNLSGRNDGAASLLLARDSKAALIERDADEEAMSRNPSSAPTNKSI